MKQMYDRRWILFVPAFVIAGLLLFIVDIPTTHAQEPCLRGGDGNCIELHTDSPAAGAASTANNMLGTSNTHSIQSLSNGTLIAAVAEYKQSFSYSGLANLLRYEIFLYTSEDGGVTWKKATVQNKKYWYVDEHRPNGGTVTNATDGISIGAGFLGYDFAITETADKAYIVLAHASACDRQGNNDPDSYVGFGEAIDDLNGDGTPDLNCRNTITGGAYGHVAGTVYADVIEYSLADKSFTEKGATTALTRSASFYSGYNPGTCQETGATGFCYGVFLGAQYPSVVSLEESGGNIHFHVSYGAFRGSNCAAVGGPDRCPDQNGSDANAAYVQDLWARDVIYATNTGAISAPGGDPVASNRRIERFPATGNGVVTQENFSFFSDITSILGNNLVAVYGLSEIDADGEATQSLKYATFNASTASWSVRSSLDGAAWVSGSLGADEHVASAVYLQNNKRFAPSVSIASSPKSSLYNAFITPGHRQHDVVHIAAYVDIDNQGTTLQRVVPAYLRLSFSSIGPADSLEGIFLADRDSSDRMSISANGQDVMPNPEAGGPNIGYHRYSVYVAVPGSEVSTDTSQFRARTTNAYIARLRAQQYISGNTIVADWSQGLSLSFLDRIHSSATYPIYSQYTPAASSTSANNGFASPHVALHAFQQNSSNVQQQILTNVFAPPMLVVHKKGDGSLNCSSTNPCSVGFSGEHNTNGIRGWAWAETVGWLSLSCSNLQSCYRKSYDADGNAWSSVDGGNYYGVRAVMNTDFPSRTLIGSAWSERVGYISFDREASVTATNPCGNPPEGYQIPREHCAALDGALSDTAASIPIKNDSSFPPSGSLRVGTEVIFYNGKNASGDLINLRRSNTSPSLANETYISVARAHPSDTPVFWLNGNDVTTDANGAHDIFRGVNSFDPTSFEVRGWARAQAWAEYQETYCVGGIGPGNASPCDKEWGWIKLTGNWETVHWGEFDNSSCGTNQLKVSSVDGYPDPPAAGTEKLYLQAGLFPPQRVWEYSGIDRIQKIFTLTQNLPAGLLCPASGTEVPWITQLSDGILAGDTEIPVESTAGLLPSGKLLIREYNPLSGALIASETVEYSGVDSENNLIQFVTRGTPASAFTVNAIVEQVSESGTYNTFMLPIADYAPEQTLAGFGWSAPNTETLTADPTISRYKDNIAGFGWINFQPNQLELIYPYLRTLFSDVYVGGNLSIVGPDYVNIDPKQYTATYQLESNGLIQSFVADQTGASAGQYLRCLEQGIADCSQFNPSPAPEINLENGATSVLGKLPKMDALADMVSDCLRWDPSDPSADAEGYVSVACPASQTEQPRKLTSLAEIDAAPTMGKNRYGNDVILCRHDPEEIISPVRSYDVFLDQAARDANPYVDGDANAYANNPPECRWELSEGFTATLSQEYVAGSNQICLTGVGGYIADSSTVIFGTGTAEVTTTYSKNASTCADGSVRLDITTAGTENVAAGSAVAEKDDAPYYTVKKSHRGASTVYTFPDDYGNTGPDGYFIFQHMPLQFTNAPEGESGAISFVLPGSAFFSDTQMRYCPQGQHLLPCKGKDDIAYDQLNPLGSGPKITSTNQLASVAWIADGSVANIDGFTWYSHFKETISYRVGAFILLGTEETQINPLLPGRYGDFMSHWSIAQSLQFKLYGMVIARSFTLYGESYVQDSDEHLIEPSEDFIYDGRAVVNPPPGLADLTTGLPTITQATP